jgi:CelD/BcsL family acetyltransferase involved in cellulose biosynthesis
VWAELAAGYIESMIEGAVPSRGPNRSLALVPQTDPLWTDLLARSPTATPFHNPAWSSAIAATYGYRPFAAVLLDGSQAAAGVPLIEVRGPTRRRRWLSLPFTDECAPLAANRDDLADLIQRLDRARRLERLAEIEIRTGRPVPGVWKRPAGVTHLLQLEADAEALRRRFSRSRVQRNIARAEREGVRIERGIDREDLTERFYRLHVATRRRQGVPVQPQRFFGELWRLLVEPGLGFVLLAYVGERAVAGALYLAWRGTVVYKFGASDAGYLNLRPNHLVMWHAIRWGCEHGFQRFDFGKSDEDNAGLRAFKSGWGTIEEPLVYSVLADGPPSPQRSSVPNALRFSISHGPLWVCRLAGAALYRYAA